MHHSLRRKAIDMTTLKGKQVVVTGGSRGLGLGIVEALSAEQADVTVVARDEERLADLKDRLGVDTIKGDVTEEAVARKVLQEVQPSVLVLNAGATPSMLPVHEHTWESFSQIWNVDVKASFHWIQAAIRLPMAQGSRVIITSSGAAINGSPLSGGYAGAKRTQLFMAAYADGLAVNLGLGIRFQAIVPMQIIGQTELGRQAAEAYARQKGVSLETYLAGFGEALPPRKVGEYVISILTDARYEKGTAFGMKGGTGIIPL
jgi:NAD(P)-dependent dehydrogenase (short-subunit alcohol dehydrogenase family)